MGEAGINNILSSLTGGGDGTGLGEMLKSITEKLDDSDLMKNIDLNDPSKTMGNLMSSMGVKSDVSIESGTDKDPHRRHSR